MEELSMGRREGTLGASRGRRARVGTSLSEAPFAVGGGGGALASASRTAARCLRRFCLAIHLKAMVCSLCALLEGAAGWVTGCAWITAARKLIVSLDQYPDYSVITQDVVATVGLTAIVAIWLIYLAGELTVRLPSACHAVAIRRCRLVCRLSCHTRLPSDRHPSRLAGRGPLRLRRYAQVGSHRRRARAHHQRDELHHRHSLRREPAGGRLLRMASDGFEWLRIICHGFEWLRIIHHGFEWLLAI